MFFDHISDFDNNFLLRLVNLCKLNSNKVDHNFNYIGAFNLVQTVLNLFRSIWSVIADLFQPKTCIQVITSSNQSKYCCHHCSQLINQTSSHFKIDFKIKKQSFYPLNSPQQTLYSSGHSGQDKALPDIVRCHYFVDVNSNCSLQSIGFDLIKISEDFDQNPCRHQFEKV